MADTAFTIRPAQPADVPSLLVLVRELAQYEREPDAVQASEEHLRAALFPLDGASAGSHAFVVDVGGSVVAMAVWYVTFSTWTGRHGIWLEDLYVRPEHRGAGLGRALLRRLAHTAVERGWARLEWWVLRWNAPSIGFYESLGARSMDEWLHYRMDGAQLLALAGEQPAQDHQGRHA